MISLNPTELHGELKVILGDERAEIISAVAVEELQRIEAWVEMSMKDFEELNAPLGSFDEEFVIDGQSYRTRVIRRSGRVAGHRVYKLHRSDNAGRVIRGWFGRILSQCWNVINPTAEEREATFKVINTYVQRELTYPDRGRHV